MRAVSASQIGRELLVLRSGLRLYLLDQRIDARLRHGLAIDDGDVLRLRGQWQREGCAKHQRRNAEGEGTLLHGQVPFNNGIWEMRAAWSAAQEVQGSSGARASMARAWMPRGISE